jgi:hypothetical protein
MVEHSEIQRYRRKPRKQTDDDSLIVARYEPGKPLDDLQRVAQMADGEAELAEVSLPSGTVLLVRWTRVPDDHPSETDWEVIEAGGYLAFSDDRLFGTDDADLRHWYDLVEREG